MCIRDRCKFIQLPNGNKAIPCQAPKSLSTAGTHPIVLTPLDMLGAHGYELTGKKEPSTAYGVPEHELDLPVGFGLQCSLEDIPTPPSPGSQSSSPSM